MRKKLVVNVFVEKTTINFDKSFSYSVPFDMCEKVAVGQRVLVPFGKGNKKRQGVIIAVSDNQQDNQSIKPIFEIIDEKPIITDEMLKLGSFMADRYFCTFFDSLKPMLPLGINVSVVKSFVLKKDFEKIDMQALSPDERLILESIHNSKGKATAKKLMEIVGVNNESVFDNLIERKIIETKENAVRRIGDASVKMVRLPDAFDEEDLIRYTVKQKQVAVFLTECQTASVKEVTYFTGVSAATVNAMIKQGKLVTFEAEVLRSPYEIADEGRMTPIVLTDEQEKAFSAIKADMNNADGGNAGLLFGVTGSGKTQVFLRAIDECINAGKNAIVMVPEIALTPQTMSIFSKRYGKKIAIFHSAMSLGSRTDEWKRVKSGEAKIAIGTRSAVFAPMENIGLIIMDEEQEHTYKSEGSPRFHARDVAKFRSKYHNCLVLMASATPSVETYCLAKSGFYSLYTLKNRYGSVTLPKVETANMKEQYKKGNFGIFSDKLTDALSETFNNKKQAIILLNRRGYQVVVTCTSCGAVRGCPNCSISMTYHTANNRMMCHYCGYSEEYTSKCSVCGEDNVRLSGFGTQKAQEELSMIFPNMRILRMDADTTMTRFSHEKKLTAFKNGEYDVMIGTQMVAKGLDFPNVTLVGVINADQLLYSNDFRGYEKTFSLLTQVIGRSGRSEEGTAVIQTISPDNEIITLSAAQDYERFYETEILQRKILKYPPYCDLCVIGFSGISKEKTFETANKLFESLKKHVETDYNDLKVIILGPSPCNIPKISNKYRFRLIIKCKNSKRFRELILKLLIESGNSAKYKNISVFADINPENII